MQHVSKLAMYPLCKSRFCAGRAQGKVGHALAVPTRHLHKGQMQAGNVLGIERVLF